MLHQKNILIIDNFDSFTFNIAQMIGEVNGQEAIVLPNTVSWREIHKIPHDRIILSPGPGTPYQRRDVGSSMDILSYAEVPVLGVCLGHQCLTLHHGGRVIAAPEPMQAAFGASIITALRCSVASPKPSTSRDTTLWWPTALCPTSWSLSRRRKTGSSWRCATAPFHTGASSSTLNPYAQSMAVKSSATFFPMPLPLLSPQQPFNTRTA